MKSFNEQFKNYVQIINNRLNNIISQNEVSNIASVMNYSLNIGGKRIRPILTLEFCRLCGGAINDAIDIACSIEMIHTYSLIHDDLPCMDNDVLRRGQPSCHIKFGEAKALLAGDCLLTEAFNIIATNKILNNDLKIKIISLLSSSVGINGMISGQDLDINQDKNKISLDNLNYINNLKTGALIRAAAISGCLIANADDNIINIVDMYATKIGLAFQILDDILDATSTEKILGKTAGNDKNNKKTTYVDLMSINKCKETVENLSVEALNIIQNEFLNTNTNFISQFTRFLINRLK